MLRFLADADFNQRILVAIRRRESTIDFCDAHQGGVIGLPDRDVLQVAKNTARILVSHDRRTMPAHFAQFIKKQSSPGLIIVPQSLDMGTVIENILLIWTASNTEEWQNQIEFLPL